MSKGNEKTIKNILPVILIAAFALRLKNIWFGYPLPLHPDESIIVQAARNIISTGDLNPHTFLYPSLNIYLNVLLYRTIRLFENIVSGIPTDAIPEIHYYLYGRALNVLFSTTTIYGVYEIGKRLCSSGVGLVATCFIAASSLHVGNAYYVTVDTSMALWCTLACLMAALIYTKGAHTLYYLAGGVCVGLAIGCKYTAFPAFVPILVAHVCKARQDGTYINKNIILATAIVPAVFFLTTPYALLDYKAFLNALAYQKKEYSIGHPGAESFLGLSIGSYCTYLFTEGYGIIPSIMALTGIPLLYHQSRSRLALLLACPLVLLLFLGIYRVYFPRNVVALVPFLSLLSAYTIVTASTWCGQKVSDWMKAERAGFLCGVLFVAISIQGQIIIDAKMMRENSLPDTRWISLLWSNDNIPVSAAIGREHYTPPLEKYSKLKNVVMLGYCGVVRKSEILPYLDFVITSSSDYSRFLDDPEKYPVESMRYNDFFARNKLIKEFSSDDTSMTGPTIRIYEIRHK